MSDWCLVISLSMLHTRILAHGIPVCDVFWLLAPHLGSDAHAGLGSDAHAGLDSDAHTGLGSDAPC